MERVAHAYAVAVAACHGRSDLGSVAVDGSVAKAISTYLSRGAQGATYIHPLTRVDSSPRITRVEVLTSEKNGVHRFGEPLEVNIWVRHPQPMGRAYLSFQIVNQFQQAVVHAFDPELTFGSRPGSSFFLCRFPALRLNVGQFYLRAFLSEPPGAEEYETLDGICQFEVVRSDRNTPWGWRPEACVYHEQYSWEIMPTMTTQR